MTVPPIPFGRVHLTGRELAYLREATERGHLAGDGAFTRRCQEWLEANIGCTKALLTHSCTGALEIAAILSGAGPGDEVIVPSFTFPSTANAFVLRGATPVFVDIEPDALTIDPERIAAAITPRTRAIVPVHYAGAACDMAAIAALADARGLLVVEDAAQALLGTAADGRPLGSIGAMAALSFHETKNVTAGEAGALLINDARFVERAGIVRDKGTNRGSFLRGEVDRYTWLDLGSSYAPGELAGAFLLAQLEEARETTARCVAIWQRYHERLAPLEGMLRRPAVAPANGHLYYVLLPTEDRRRHVIRALADRGITAAFHYVPLHSSPAGLAYGRTAGPMDVTDDLSRRLLRLPLWPGMTEEQVDRVVSALAETL
jgi:dTDP-4-amino-4,6-dideoxygalactose transaminase